MCGCAAHLVHSSKLELTMSVAAIASRGRARARADAGRASTFERQQREQIQQDLGEGFRHPVLLVQPVPEEERIAACSVARHVEQPNMGLPAAVVRSHLCGIQGPKWPANAVHTADWSRPELVGQPGA